MKSLSVATLCVALAAVPAAAQQTRAEELAALQAEKAAQLKPYEPTRVERRIELLERHLLNPPPFYPFIGSVMAGGWLSVGPGYRQKLPGAALFDVHGAYSLRNYKLAETTVNVPLAGSRVKVLGEIRWIDAPSVAFFGVGGDTPPEDRTSFAYRTTTAGGTVAVRPVRFVGVGGRLHYLKMNTGTGRIPPRMASGTPGLGADPEYTVSGAYAEFDWRDGAAYSRRGGRYRAEWTRYDERNNRPYSFNRVDGEIDQFVPLLRANWIIAMRALASYTNTGAGQTVPYFLMPDLGGSRMLRGYASWRFRDLNRMLLTGEYRWTAGQFVDMALFLDAGKVMASRSDFTMNGLKTSYGIGVRFHTPAATPLRIELARTHDGLGLVFAFGPSF